MRFSHCCYAFFVGCCLVMTSCSQKPTQNHKTLKIASLADPQTLDPRKARDLTSINHIHLLYAALMEKDLDGALVYDLAASHTVSEDQRVYTFTLKDLYWSNQEKLTANDFVFAISSSLEPGFIAPNAYLYFMLEGAQQIHEGHEAVLGVRALDDKTVEFRLTQPREDFLETLTTHAYFPVLASAAWQERFGFDPKVTPSIGPYLFDQWDRQQTIRFLKNPGYTKAQDIDLERVEFYTLDEMTALNLYESGALDFVGSPLGTLPIDAKIAYCDRLKHDVASGNRFLRCHVRHELLQDPQVRKLLGQVIDRESIVQNITCGGEVASSEFVPLFLKTYQISPVYETTIDPEALKAIERAKPLVLSYASSELNSKLAQVLQKTWENTLGIHVQLKPYQSKAFFETLQNLEYDLAISTWYAEVNTPSNFLGVFQKDVTANRTAWFDKTYDALLEQAAKATTIQESMEFLGQAEQRLLEQQPVIPLYHATFSYLMRPELDGIQVLPQGYLNLKHAHFRSHDS